MKFQLIALAASAQAIRIRSEAKDVNCTEIAHQIYEHCDKNGDHGISWKEARACGAPKDFKPVFNHIDHDGDGVVDLPEFVSECEKHMGLAQGSGSSGGPPSCDDMADAIYQHCDSNGDEGITWKEARACGAPKDFKPAFDLIDGDDDGTVERPEFISFCDKHMSGLAQEAVEQSSGGPPSCADVADQIFQHCDGNHDGELTWAEASGCGAPQEFHAEFTKAAGANGTLDHAEFVSSCEDHTGLAQDKCEDIGEQILNHCDKNDDDMISWREARGCGAPKKWRKRFLKVAGADKKIDGKEFLSACRSGKF